MIQENISISHWEMPSFFPLVDTSLSPKWSRVTLPTHSSLYSTTQVPDHALDLSHIPNMYTHICMYFYINKNYQSISIQFQEFSEEPPFSCDI